MRYKEFIAVLIICCVAGCNKNDNTVSNLTNSAPVIQGIISIPDSVVLGASCLVEVFAADSDGDKLTYMWESPGIISGSGSTIYYTPNSCCGAPKIMVTVKDSKGGSHDTVITVPTKG
jgi:hypothetical protein